MNRLFAAAVAASVVSASTLGCSQPAQPGSGIVQGPAQNPVPFPDSVTLSNGIPPRAGDSSTVVLGDTLAVGQIGAPPVYGGASPMKITARFFARDTSNSVFRPRDLPVTACPFVLMLSRVGDARIAWRSDRAAPSLACPALQRFSGTDVNATWDVPAILGDSLPIARYHAALDVKAADGRVFHYAAPSPLYLDTSAERPLVDYSVLEFNASSAVIGGAPRYLDTRVIIRNTSSKSVEVDYGACSVNVRLYRNAERSGTPVWKSELRKPPGSSWGYVCILPLYTSVLSPGDSLAFPLKVPMYEVIGDSLASGHYFVSAELSLARQRGADGLSPPDLTKAVAAGELDIVREAERLPSSRITDSVAYTATTRVIPGNGDDTLRTLVLVRNLSSQTIKRTIVPACPIIIYGYRSAALRDSVPIVNTSVAPGPSCSFAPHPFTLGPGQSWVFGTDTPMSAIRGRFGTGHFWFTAWLTTTNQVLLAAGDAEVK
jgi:hypothetical protein